MTTGGLPVAEQFALEHQVIDQPESAGSDLHQDLVDFVAGEIGEESQMPEIDPHHGYLAISHPPRRAEDRAVPAEDDHQIDLVWIGSLGVETTLPPISLRRRPVDHGVAVALQRCSDSFGHLTYAGKPGRGHDGHMEVVRCR